MRVLRIFLAGGLALGLAGCLRVAVPTAQTPAPSPSRGPVSLAALYTPGEVRAFRIVQAGITLGHSYGRYVGTDDRGRHVFETKVEIRIPARPVARSEGRILYDEQGHVVEGFERSEGAEIRFVRKDDLLVLESGRQRDEIAYAPERSAVVAIARYVILHQEIAWATMDLGARDVEARVISLSGGPAVPWSASVEETAEGLRLSTSLGETIELVGRKIARIDVPDDDLRVEVDPSATWPTWQVQGPLRLSYTPPADAPWSVRAVEIPATADAPRLAGEVLVPHGKGPHPAVLFLSGAGRQDRYGFSEPPPVDARTHVWTDALARAGFAVLRFDDRGTGGSADGRLDFRAEAEDARRALGTLLVQDDVDPRRVTVVGHGEGGWHALFLARSDPSIRAVVLVGTPGRRYDRIVRHQSEVALAGLPPEARAESLGELDAILAGLRRPRAETVGGKVAEEPEDTAYLRQILAVDPDRLFRGVCAKVLVVQGGADFEVDPKADPAALVAAARATGVDVAQATYPHVDHHLVRIDGPGRPQRYLDRQRPVHMPAVDRMATFLAEAVAADDAPGTCPRGVRGDDTAVQSTSRPVR